MPSLRIAAIPTDHVVAELAAFPICSEEAFWLSVIRLDPSLRGSSGDLWRWAEKASLGGAPAFSVDEAVAIRDRLWFSDRSRKSLSLARYLKQLATQYLASAGRAARPTFPGQGQPIAPDAPRILPVRARQNWRWFTFAMPPDLLLAAAGLRVGEIDLVCPTLAANLYDKGFAECHLHVGAGFDFPIHWCVAMYAVAQPQVGAAAFRSPGAPFQEGCQLGPWLVRAALARYLLAAFLSHRMRRGERLGLKEYLEERVYEKVAASMSEIEAEIIRLALLELARGRFQASGLDHAHFRDCYAQLTGADAKKPALDRKEAYALDPVHAYFPASAGKVTSEVLFVQSALQYLDPGDSLPSCRDLYFERLFWQAVRVRGIFYRYVVQRPMTPGLQWFTRSYSRIGKTRNCSLTDDFLVQRAAQTCGLGRGLRALEIRTSPDPDPASMRSYAQCVLKAGRRLAEQSAAAETTGNNSPSLEVGVVLHFIKDRGGGARHGRPQAHWKDSAADPLPSRNQCVTGYRYAHSYEKIRPGALSFGELLLRFPLSLRLLRGVDAANDELGVPTWVLAPLFRYVREAGKLASEHLQARCGLPIPALRTTVHVGEDYVHLLGGLRRIYEAIHFLGLSEGDRIGHGVALGVEAKSWAEQAGHIPVLREERLFDLVWEWCWYSREEQVCPLERSAMLEREISRLSELIFGTICTPYEMELLLEDLHREDSLRKAGFPWGFLPVPPEEAPDRHTRLVQYLTDPEVFQAGRHIEWIDPRGEGQVLEILQSCLRRRVGSLGLTVEVNPSSNLLIGNLCDLARHPLWRLRPPVDPGDAPPVPICIGSDDPLTFATSLRHEYGLLYDTLVEAGLSDDQAQGWLDRVRDRGLQARFTLPVHGRWQIDDYQTDELLDRIKPIL